MPQNHNHQNDDNWAAAAADRYMRQRRLAVLRDGHRYHTQEWVGDDSEFCDECQFELIYLTEAIRGRAGKRGPEWVEANRGLLKSFLLEARAEYTRDPGLFSVTEAMRASRGAQSEEDDSPQPVHRPWRTIRTTAYVRDALPDPFDREVLLTWITMRRHDGHRSADAHLTEKVWDSLTRWFKSPAAYDPDRFPGLAPEDFRRVQAAMESLTMRNLRERQNTLYQRLEDLVRLNPTEHSVLRRFLNGEKLLHVEAAFCVTAPDTGEVTLVIDGEPDPGPSVEDDVVGDDVIEWSCRPEALDTFERAVQLMATDGLSGWKAFCQADQELEAGVCAALVAHKDRDPRKYERLRKQLTRLLDQRARLADPDDSRSRAA